MIFAQKMIVAVREGCQLTLDFLLTELKFSSQTSLCYKIFLHTFCSLSIALLMLTLVKVELRCASARSKKLHIKVALFQNI